MADKKKPRQSLMLALFGIFVFPVKITSVYFINCAKDVAHATRSELRAVFKSSDEQRWGR